VQQHVADDGESAAGGARGGGVGGVGGVVVRVLARWAPAGRRRRKRRRLRRAGAQRLGLVRGGREVRGEAGAIRGHGRGVVVSDEGGSGRLLPGHGASATVAEREAVRAQPLVPATNQEASRLFSDFIEQGDPQQNASDRSLAPLVAAMNRAIKQIDHQPQLLRR